MDKKNKNEIPILETKYPVNDLIDNCEALTSYKKEVAVGALFNCDKEEISKNEFKELIDTFLNTKAVKED